MGDKQEFHFELKSCGIHERDRKPIEDILEDFGNDKPYDLVVMAPTLKNKFELSIPMEFTELASRAFENCTQHHVLDHARQHKLIDFA